MTILTDKGKSAISRESKNFTKNDPKLPKKHLSCTEEEQKRILNYLSTGKGIVPYESITRYDSLDIIPENGQFFLPHKFYSSIKDTTMTNEEYENKKIYQTMKLQNLGQLHKIYSFKDTIILCETFEQHCSHLQDLLKFNPRKCNSVSPFSGCLHRDKSNCCIALPTDTEHVRVFEKKLIGGFSCVNTRLTFGAKMLLDNNKNEKLVFDLYISGKNNKQKEFQLTWMRNTSMASA